MVGRSSLPGFGEEPGGCFVDERAPGRVDAVVIDAIDEEIIAEYSTRPAQVCVAEAVGDRLPQGIRADEEADLFAKFTCGGLVEEFAVVHAATWCQPTMAPLIARRIEEELQEQHSVNAVQQDHPCRAASV